MNGNLFCGFLMSNLAASCGNSFVGSWLTTEGVLFLLSCSCSCWEEGLLWPCCLKSRGPCLIQWLPAPASEARAELEPFFQQQTSCLTCLEVPQRAELQLDGQRDVLALGLPLFARGRTLLALSFTVATGSALLTWQVGWAQLSQALFWFHHWPRTWAAEARGNRVLILFGSVLLHSILLFLSWLIPWLL